MNIIPSIFNERQINRTVLGGTESASGVKMNVSVVLLNSGSSHFRIQMIENLLKCGFTSIVSLEPTPESYNIEDFGTKFPSVRFIIPLEKVTDGDLINIGISESCGEYVLVLRDTLRIPPGILMPNLAEHLTENGSYCIVPRLVTPEKQSLPVQFIPEAVKSKLHVISSSSVSDGMATLCPFNYIGLYHRQKFMLLGGFDYTITSPYWQNLDMAFRAWLWGEKINLSTAFQLEYAEKVPQEEITADFSQLRFYLKNLVPRYHEDHGMIPFSSFFLFARSSSCGFFETRRLFADACRWVDKNKYRFKQDAVMLIENWDKQK
jgi:hypothetical protein